MISFILILKAQSIGYKTKEVKHIGNRNIGIEQSFNIGSKYLYHNDIILGVVVPKNNYEFSVRINKDSVYRVIISPKEWELLFKIFSNGKIYKESE